MGKEEFTDILTNKPYEQPDLRTQVLSTSEEEKGLRQERDHIFLEFTRSICPDCREVIDAHVFARDGKVFMKKRCKNHGLFESLRKFNS